MTTKLTLSIDESVIIVAKKYAKINGKSLSNLVENYLLTLATSEIKEEAISNDILKLMGVIELPVDFNYKESLSHVLANKYK